MNNKPLTDREKERIADLSTRADDYMSPWLRGELKALQEREKGTKKGSPSFENEPG